MIELYDDQREIVDAVRARMQSYKAVLLQSPTGSGKTAMAVNMIAGARAKGRKIVFTVPRRDLMEQTSETFERMGLAHSFVAHGKGFNASAGLYIGMVDTMSRRIARLPNADLVIVDETHFGEGALGAIIERYRKTGAWVLGLSATPWKLSGKGLGCWYDSMVEGKPIRWLMDNGRLSDYRYYAGRTKPDLTRLKVTAGDYAKGELASFMEAQGAIIGDCVSDYKQRCEGNLHVVRCASIKHSQMMAESFRAAGYNFVHVDGETPMDERKKIFRAYAQREILGLTFCDLLNFGFDLSQASGGLDVCIESGSDAKPTKSLAGQMQFWGRMLRAKEKPATIHDHVNNFIEHGYPDDEREWSLEDRPQGKRSGSSGAAMVKQCERCFYCHRPAPQCPQCGNVYEIKSREIDEIDGELREMTKDERELFKRELQKRKKDEVRNAKSLESLIALGHARGYQHPEQWARIQYNLKNGGYRGKSR